MAERFEPPHGALSPNPPNGKGRVQVGNGAAAAHQSTRPSASGSGGAGGGMQGGSANPWLALIAVIIGTFMSVLDSTIVNVAVPRFQSIFGADIHSVQWVLTAYLLTLAVIIPLTGWLSDKVGIKRTYLIVLASFTIGSALCGLSWNLSSLIFFRILQGIGGGALLPLGTAFIYLVMPRDKIGLASGLFGIPVLLAPAIGPVLGGYLVEYVDWRLIFYINLPIGILAFILASALLPERRVEHVPGFDFAGFILSSLGLGMLLYALSEAATYGWTSFRVESLLTVSILSLVAFVILEVRTRNPLLNLKLFANFNFAMGNFLILVVTAGLFGGVFLLPIFLQNLRGLSPFQTGLILVPQAIAAAITLPIGGILFDRFGARIPLVFGFIVLSISTWILAHITIGITNSTLFLVLILRGIALGCSITSVQTSAMFTIPKRFMANASATFNVLRQVGASLAIAILATILQTRSVFHYQHLAEQVTPGSKSALLLLNLQLNFERRVGYDAPRALHAAQVAISGLLHRQAAVLSFQDAFWLTMVVSIFAIFPALFVNAQKKVAPGQAGEAPGEPVSSDAPEVLAAVH